MVDLSEIEDCDTCRAYFKANGWQIINASAEVAVGKAEPTRQVVAEYMVAFHAGGHSLDG